MTSGTRVCPVLSRRRYRSIGGKQDLAVITRKPEGYEQVNYEQVSFVPLVGGEV